MELRVRGDVVGPPVVLAPMAGITNRAFRRLCREAIRGEDTTAGAGAAAGAGGQAGAGSRAGGRAAGLFVSEMITSRALLERHPDTLAMTAFDVDEAPRSLQLYGVDPRIVGDAVRMVADEDRADHIDLNFGCPVPKVTRKGGGSALPWKRDLFRAIVREAVRAADGRVPVTVKMRTGIDDDHLTYLDAGLAASQEGAAWVALHGRTAAQRYGGTADRSAVARLVELLHPLGTPVLGNGDIWTAGDALSMVAETGCAGVVVGRGCLGRPWLFGQLDAAFAGRPIPGDPDFRGVAATMRRHAALLAEVLGPDKGVRDFRKHVAWYTKGFAVGTETRNGLAMVSTLEELDGLLGRIDPDQPYPAVVAGAPRGRTSGEKRPSLPDGWLDSRLLGEDDDLSALAEAEVGVSGG